MLERTDSKYRLIRILGIKCYVKLQCFRRSTPLLLPIVTIAKSKTMKISTKAKIFQTWKLLASYYTIYDLYYNNIIQFISPGMFYPAYPCIKYYARACISLFVFFFFVVVSGIFFYKYFNRKFNVTLGTDNFGKNTLIYKFFLLTTATPGHCLNNVGENIFLINNISSYSIIVMGSWCISNNKMIRINNDHNSKMAEA